MADRDNEIVPVRSTVQEEKATMDTNNTVREALMKIAQLASAAIGDNQYGGNRHSANGPSKTGAQVCTLRMLPERMLVDAAKTAIKINPVNAPSFGPLVAAGLTLKPMHIAVVTSKYWGPTPRQLTVSFMESADQDLRTRILSHMNAWTRTACVSFVETEGDGDVRISRDPGGYWSYLGTDILHVPKNRQTMNLEAFTMNTPESEYRRVVRHETGHTLGFPHEHMRPDLVARIDPDKAYAYFLENYGWDQQTVDEQVLTALDEASLMGTPADQTSIMCYQLPDSITRDGEPILGGTDVNETDYAFAGQIYPKPGEALIGRRSDEWAPSEDVHVHL